MSLNKSIEVLGSTIRDYLQESKDESSSLYETLFEEAMSEISGIESSVLKRNIELKIKEFKDISLKEQSLIHGQRSFLGKILGMLSRLLFLVLTLVFFIYWIVGFFVKTSDPYFYLIYFTPAFFYFFTFSSIIMVRIEKHPVRKKDYVFLNYLGYDIIKHLKTKSYIMIAFSPIIFRLILRLLGLSIN